MDKQQIRELVWHKLVKSGVARPPLPPEGRIPNFEGSERAADRLCSLRVYREADTVFANPDSPQLPLRERILRDGKRLIMASPRLRRGLLTLANVRSPREAATIRGALRFGRSVKPWDVKVDLMIEGSVAVDLQGGRVGKGGGFGDLEFAILKEARAVTDSVPIATTVHEIQIVNAIPLEPHDVPVDLILTPRRTLRVVGRPPRPEGVLWYLVGDRMLRDIPLLRELKNVSGPGGI